MKDPMFPIMGSSLATAACLNNTLTGAWLIWKPNVLSVDLMDPFAAQRAHFSLFSRLFFHGRLPQSFSTTVLRCSEFPLLKECRCISQPLASLSLWRPIGSTEGTSLSWGTPCFVTRRRRRHVSSLRHFNRKGSNKNHHRPSSTRDFNSCKWLKIDQRVMTSSLRITRDIHFLTSDKAP